MSLILKKIIQIWKYFLERNDKLKYPSRIFNLDDTSTITVQKPEQVIAEKGTKQINHYSSGERGVLVILCVLVQHKENIFIDVLIW